MVDPRGFEPLASATRLPSPGTGGQARLPSPLDLSRIELLSPQCECGVLPLYYRPKGHGGQARLPSPGTGGQVRMLRSTNCPLAIAYAQALAGESYGPLKYLNSDGAGERSRTSTGFLPPGPKPGAYANFATPAIFKKNFFHQVLNLARLPAVGRYANFACPAPRRGCGATPALN